MKKCKVCGDKFIPQFSSLDPVCTKYDCRVEFALKTAEKSKLAKQKDFAKRAKLEKRELRENLKTLSDWKEDFQKEINALVRAIDEGWGCIATNTLQGKRNAGHYVSVGANNTIRFHLENIWVQSEHSNTFKSGDTIRYQDGIRRLFGQEYLDYMDSLRSIPPIKLTIDDIKEKIPIVRSLIKWCKLQDRTFTLSERVELRRRFNKEIGIYN
jgi:hypothetical protein